MKKDIPQYKVEEVAIAIIPRPQSEEDEILWDTYILNLREEPIKSVLISSRGYGEIKGEKMKTTMLRHFFEEIGSNSFAMIEPIQSKLFNLTNEYWISFSLGEYMFDKKYVFVKGSIDPANFTNIPLLNQKGVMIK